MSLLIEEPILESLLLLLEKLSPGITSYALSNCALIVPQHSWKTCYFSALPNTQQVREKKFSVDSQALV